MLRLPTTCRFAVIAPCLVSAILLINAATAVADISMYTDKDAWINALGGPYLTEDFDDEKLNSGVSFDSSESGHINTTFGYYQDVLVSKSNNEPFTTWHFSPLVFAYGGNWTFGGPGGGGNSLRVYLDDMSIYVGAIGNSYNGEFWGFISDGPFTSVTLIGGTGDQQQNYRLDNMVYSHVPEPRALCLWGIAMIGILLTFRRYRSA